MFNILLPFYLAALIGAAIALPVLATGSQPSAAPVQEDPLLKTVQPGAAPAPKREGAAATGDRKQPGKVRDSDVQQDPLLRTIDPGRQAPAMTEKSPMKTDKQSQPEKTVQDQEKGTKKKKDTKVQEDPLLKTLGP